MAGQYTTMTANITPLFEHETKQFDWTDRDLAELERLNRATGVDVLRATVRGKQRMLKAAQYVGVIRLGRRTIQVLPKIYQSNDAVCERAWEATRNLLYMLEYAGQLPIREHALAPLLQRDLDWFEILTRLFASHLTQEWQRGAYRGYQVIEDELPVLKGKWRIADQLRYPERKHIFTVAYDEFTSDNRLNRVFRFVVERLWCLTRDAETRQQLSMLRQWLEEVTLLPKVTVADASPTLLTRLNQRFEPLLNLARLFLDDGALQLTARDLKTFAFVFDMNQLFESFVVNFIRRHRHHDVLPPTLQECELLPQSHRAPFYLARMEMDGKPVFRLKPDLAFRNGDRFPLLMDAKYKRLDAAETKLGVSQSDFYQMYAYAHRYHCPRVLLLYPQTATLSEPLRKPFPLEDSNKVIVAATVNLRVELGKPDSLVEEMREIFQEVGQL
jgi:5-methylcytosine-specific restriction enzyme subunit McrC